MHFLHLVLSNSMWTFSPRSRSFLCVFFPLSGSTRVETSHEDSPPDGSEASGRTFRPICHVRSANYNFFFGYFVCLIVSVCFYRTSSCCCWTSCFLRPEPGRKWNAWVPLGSFNEPPRVQPLNVDGLRVRWIKTTGTDVELSKNAHVYYYFECNVYVQLLLLLFIYLCNLSILFTYCMCAFI